MRGRLLRDIDAMRTCSEVGAMVNAALAAKLVRDPNLRRQEGLAERIASKNLPRHWNPDLWDIHFRRALEAIQEFEQEFGGNNG